MAQEEMQIVLENATSVVHGSYHLLLKKLQTKTGKLWGNQRTYRKSCNRLQDSCSGSYEKLQPRNDKLMMESGNDKS